MEQRSVLNELRNDMSRYVTKQEVAMIGFAFLTLIVGGGLVQLIP